MEKRRVSSGIHGLDEAIGGGFLDNSINLVVGGPGAGKSIFAMQFLVDGAMNGDNGVYITFEEKKESILKNLDFSWNLESLEKEGKLLIMEFSPDDLKKIIKHGLLELEFQVKKKMQAKRIVIDSVSAYYLLFENENEGRDGLLKLFNLLKSWNLTALLTAEYETEKPSAYSIPEFQSDTVIRLYNQPRGGARERYMEILKMRGTKHSANIFPLKITDKGIEVYPQERILG